MNDDRLDTKRSGRAPGADRRLDLRRIAKRMSEEELSAANGGSMPSAADLALDAVSLDDFRG
jgi:hypothetical protein